MSGEFLIQIVVLIVLLACSLGIARWLGQRSMFDRLRELQLRLEQSEANARHARKAASEAIGKAEQSEANARDLEHSLKELPEISHRLSGTRNLREIPQRTLELVQEIFHASYAIFYRCDENGLVAVATHGDSEFSVGHRLELGQGIAGWTALKQMALTPDEIEFESGIVRGRNLAHGNPTVGFSMSLPVLRSNRTIGVILVGPSTRRIRCAVDLGRSIASMTSVAITSTLVLREQEQLAHTDGLTGLLNKRRILHHAERSISSQERSCHTLSIFLFDIDHFKNYNDTNGHQPGDELLKSVSAMLRSSLREGEYLGRYGGEEFLLILADVDKDEALRAADRIRGQISSHKFPHGESQPMGRISISGGVATWPGDAPDVATLIRCADEALYKAKHAGRDRVFAYQTVDLGLPDEHDLVTLDVLEDVLDEEKREDAPPARRSGRDRGES